MSITLLFLTTFFFLLLAPTFTLPLHHLALLSLKSSLVDPLNSLSSWSDSQPFCSWSGVTCITRTNSSHISHLDISNKNLSGFISPHIRLLYSTLTHLNISRNSFTGKFPDSIFNLRNLESLDISHNDFNSVLPESVSNLKKLSYFNAYSNSFVGALPRGISDMKLLQYLNLGGSYFNGSIPEDICNLSKLQYLHLAGNLLTGRIPEQIGNLTSLQHLEIGYNMYYGELPKEIGNLQELKYLDLSSSNLSGTVPSEFGKLGNLESMFIFKNRISGEIPLSFLYMKSLKAIDLSDNGISGSIPEGFSSLTNLTLISLMNNNISGDIPSGIGNLQNLQALLLWNNSLTGNLPANLGSNSKLEKLDVSSNVLSGPIPVDLCKGNKLSRLILFSNKFNSNIPENLANCSSLWRVRIQSNTIHGKIPFGLGFLPNLTFLDISDNNIIGEVPSDLQHAQKLQYLNISNNPLQTILPKELWKMPNIQVFSASSCKLYGAVPNFKHGCEKLYKLELENNGLAGSIPADIGTCQKLLSLNINRNKLTGSIPNEMSKLPMITDVDLSFNNLSGQIPSDFVKIRTLENFNVSYNQLIGRINLKNFKSSSFKGNKGLCGEVVGVSCANGDVMKDRRSLGKSVVIVWVGVMAVGIGILVILVTARRAKGRKEDNMIGAKMTWKMTAFQILSFTADDVAVAVEESEWVLGMGASGTVYRAEMPSGEIIAVKKLWGKQKDSKIRKLAGVLSEVEVLGSVRHRNIVRLLGYCSNKETTMLLYEYMPNGSLEDFLHRKGDNKTVSDWETRYRIAVGIAEGICYLHHDCDPVIIHRDLKPSNILLDEEMDAKIADFGVAKLIYGSSPVMSVVAGSYGYIAPEYAYTLQVDQKSDVYSFGVVLLEIVTGRRAVETEFGEGNNIVNWVRDKLLKEEKGKVERVLDSKIVGVVGCNEVREEMILFLRVALLCTAQKSSDRPTMRDVVSMLQVANFHKGTEMEDKKRGRENGGKTYV